MDGYHQLITNNKKPSLITNYNKIINKNKENKIILNILKHLLIQSNQYYIMKIQIIFTLYFINDDLNIFNFF